VLGRALWLLGYGLNLENKNAAVSRANNAARFLIEAARDGNNVLLLGHGWISRYIRCQTIRRCPYRKFRMKRNLSSCESCYRIDTLK